MDAATQFQSVFRLHQSGDLLGAARGYQEILDQFPDYFDALHFLGVVKCQEGDFAQALSLLERAVQIVPDVSDVYLHLGNAYLGADNPEKALENYNAALRINPKCVRSWYQRANVLRDLGVHDQALLSYNRVLENDPEHVFALFYRGRLQEEMGQYEDALLSYQEALGVREEFATWFYYAHALFMLGRYDEALSSFDRALLLDLEHAEGWLGRGNVLKKMGRYKEAIESYERTLSIDSESVAGHFYLAQCQLLLGDFEHGWENYEWRRKVPELPNQVPQFLQPVWTGKESLKDKTILLHAEQSYGDMIHFSRYVTLVKELGAKIVLAAPKSLAVLFARLPGVGQIVVSGQPYPYFDYYCPLMSLPHVFKTNLLNIPAAIPYLFCNGDALTRWEERLGRKKAFRVGIVWTGNPREIDNRIRSVRLTDFAFLEELNVDIFCLQKELTDVDKFDLASHSKMHAFDGDIHDFADTSALIVLMDVVITVDTAVAHLAGAMGKPVWILLSAAHDWRWLLDRPNTPWYPSARLFRQKTLGDWAPLFSSVKERLQEVLKGKISML